MKNLNQKQESKGEKDNNMQEKKSYILEKIKTANLTSVLIVSFCGLFLIGLLFIEVPKDNKDIVNFLSGSFFGTCLSAVMYFLFNYRKKEYKENE